jgi:uncharacterized damage-inducible protein DinB
MRNVLLVGMAASLLWGASAVGASQQASATSASVASTASMAPADKSTPSYDMKAQAALDLQQLQDRFVSLAQAIPADKYTWRPSEGVRSISEMFLHVSGANYGIPTMVTGMAPAPGYQKDGFEKSTTDKAKIIEQLNKSFAYAIAAVQSMSNSDFARPEKKLGPEANSGDVVYLLVTNPNDKNAQANADARIKAILQR